MEVAGKRPPSAVGPAQAWCKSDNEQARVDWPEGRNKATRRGQRRQSRPGLPLGRFIVSPASQVLVEFVFFDLDLGALGAGTALEEAPSIYRCSAAAPFSTDARRTPIQTIRRRWLVERFFAWIQGQRRILVRWEYHTQNFLGFVQLALRAHNHLRSDDQGKFTY
jgi:hypothetical protein